MRNIVQDLRPVLASHTTDASGVIVADFTSGGHFKVDYVTRFGEKRTIPFLTKPQASFEVSKLRSRGYRANVKQMA